MLFLATIFRFASLSLGDEASALLARFPNGSHEFTDGGTRHYRRDDPARFDSLIRKGTGEYSIRLDSSESNVWYMSIKIESGRIRQVLFSFEKPSEKLPPSRRNSKDEFGGRHPDCAAIRVDLARSYGDAAAIDKHAEEALLHQEFIWRLGKEELRLDCGRYMNTSRQFAMSVSLHGISGR